MAAPSLGYGNRSEASIDAVNQYMRQAPWYQSLIRSFGQQPNNVHLSDAQKQQVIRAAQANGIVVDEGHNGQEVDDSGNFRPKSHTLKNTLIVAGIAGAALATMGAAGVFGGAAAAGSEGAAAGAGATLGPTSAATIGATSAALGAGAPAGIAAGTGAVGTGLGLAGAAAAAGTKGLSYADILKYGLPVAGNLAGNIIQANAEGKASDAQQKYLEEALAYEKEKDAYQRNIDAQAVAREEQRYGAYQGRIAPFIANGTSSNDRMSSLLGLPARSGGSGGSYGVPTSQGVALSPEITARVLQNYKDLGVTPTGPGTGPTDSAYMASKIAETGGLTDANNSYWFSPSGRIAQELQKSGIPLNPAAQSAPTTPAVTTPAATSGAPVQMKAPDGSVKAVPANQVQHYLSLGATLMGATG